MPSLTAPPDNTDPDGAAVTLDGWYPAIPLAEIRDTLRIGDGVVTTERLTAAIEGAAVSAMRALADWRALREAAGAGALTDVTDVQINGKNYAVLLFHRIIRHFAGAELGDMHRDVSATDDGLDRADEKRQTADDHRRLAYHAVSDLKSVGATERVQRNHVDLI